MYFHIKILVIQLTYVKALHKQLKTNMLRMGRCYQQIDWHLLEKPNKKSYCFHWAPQYKIYYTTLEYIYFLS